MPLALTYSTILKAAKPVGYKAVHAAADKLEPRLRRAIRDAMRTIRDEATLKRLAAAIENRDMRLIEELVADANIEIAMRTITEDLQRAFSEAAAAASDHLPREVRAQMVFDLLNPRSVEFLRSYKLNLIRRISNDTRESIRGVLLDAFASGGHPYEQARRIKPLIGLLPRQRLAVSNFRDLLVEEGRKAADIDRLTASYAERQLTARARNIARTETIRAANAGQEEAWKQAAETGLIDGAQSKKRWIVTPDDRLCPICAPVPGMNPDGVPLSGTFNTDRGAVRAPPLHPQCRCALALIPV